MSVQWESTTTDLGPIDSLTVRFGLSALDHLTEAEKKLILQLLRSVHHQGRMAGIDQAGKAFRAGGTL